MSLAALWLHSAVLDNCHRLIRASASRLFVHTACGALRRLSSGTCSRLIHDGADVLFSTSHSLPCIGSITACTSSPRGAGGGQLAAGCSDSTTTRRRSPRDAAGSTWSWRSNSGPAEHGAGPSRPLGRASRLAAQQNACNDHPAHQNSQGIHVVVNIRGSERGLRPIMHSNYSSVSSDWQSGFRTEVGHRISAKIASPEPLPFLGYYRFRAEVPRSLCRR